jgi:uncharacterized membrane protein
VPTAATHFDLAPHCALSPRGAVRFFAAVCFVTLGIAAAFAFLGFWPVLPFAGAEMLLLGWALKANMARRFAREHIDITESEVIIDFAIPPRRVVFQRHWARVKILRPNSTRTSLVIESHGRVCEVGKFLTGEERRQLAAQLKLLVGGMGQLPVLPRTGSTD